MSINMPGRIMKLLLNIGFSISYNKTFSFVFMKKEYRSIFMFKNVYIFES